MHDAGWDEQRCQAPTHHRAEAARTAARPITIVQTIGLLCGAAAIVAVVGFTLPVFAHWFGGLGHLLPAADAPESIASSEPSVLRWVWPLAIGACVLLAPLAAYLAVREET